MILGSRYFWFKYDLGQKYHAPQVRPDRGSNSQPPDHDNTYHVTETLALTTRPSVTSRYPVCILYSIWHYLKHFDVAIGSTQNWFFMLYYDKIENFIYGPCLWNIFGIMLWHLVSSNCFLLDPLNPFIKLLVVTLRMGLSSALMGKIAVTIPENIGI